MTQKTDSKPTALFLMGPTASGKTDLAIQLRQSLPVEVISVDSALIYKGMDIGTAKPSKEELALAPHRLIDILDPAESYSAMNFRDDAPLPSADEKLRLEIEEKAQKFGWPALHQELQKIDPISAERINPNDSQRINRALEVFYLTDKSLTELTEQKGEELPYQFLQFAIAPEDRAVLHQRIEQRFHKMIELGFQEEVEKLYQREDLHPDLPSIRCVGYRQMWEYLRGDYGHEEMVFRGICATRQLAKRQITWLRGWKTPLNWLDSLQPQQAKEIVLRKIDEHFKG